MESAKASALVAESGGFAGRGGWGAWGSGGSLSGGWGAPAPSNDTGGGWGTLASSDNVGGWGSSRGDDWRSDDSPESLVSRDRTQEHEDQYRVEWQCNMRHADYLSTKHGKTA